MAGVLMTSNAKTTSQCQMHPASTTRVCVALRVPIVRPRSLQTGHARSAALRARQQRQPQSGCPRRRCCVAIGHASEDVAAEPVEAVRRDDRLPVPQAAVGVHDVPGLRLEAEPPVVEPELAVRVVAEEPLADLRSVRSFAKRNLPPEKEQRKLYTVLGGIAAKKKSHG